MQTAGTGVGANAVGIAAVFIDNDIMGIAKFSIVGSIGKRNRRADH